MYVEFWDTQYILRSYVNASPTTNSSKCICQYRSFIDFYFLVIYIYLRSYVNASPTTNSSKCICQYRSFIDFYFLVIKRFKYNRWKNDKQGQVILICPWLEIRIYYFPNYIVINAMMYIW